MDHADQQRIWEEEHTSPRVLPPMDSSDPSHGVVLFAEFLAKNAPEKLSGKGIEMGCGKGRNTLYLATRGAHMTGFDFSPAAVAAATKRMPQNMAGTARFLVHDATEDWPFSDDTFDFAIDCFASTDIESPVGRSKACAEFFRVLRPGGYLLVYTLSPDDAFHRKMAQVSPGPEKNSFLHPKTGKFEKFFDRAELSALYSQFSLIAEERISKEVTFFGKPYPCRHFWLVWQKPD